MKVLIVGCGWVGTYVGASLCKERHAVWATCRSPEKALALQGRGVQSSVVDFDRDELPPKVGETMFDVVIVSVPATRKDALESVVVRFDRLVAFLKTLSFGQLLFFGSIGIYPHVSAVIDEDTFGEHQLDPKLWCGEWKLRSSFPALNVLRLGGLFGFERILAKYFVGKVCEVGYQPANFVHVEDVYGVIRTMMETKSCGATYNVVCPEHPLKKDVITASARKYGYGLPAAYTTTNQTAKVVSSERLVTDLAYPFVYRSPLLF